MLTNNYYKFDNGYDQYKHNMYGKWYLENLEFWDVGQTEDLGKLMALHEHLGNLQSNQSSLPLVYTPWQFFSSAPFPCFRLRKKRQM